MDYNYLLFMPRGKNTKPCLILPENNKTVKLSQSRCSCSGWLAISDSFSGPLQQIFGSDL